MPPEALYRMTMGYDSILDHLPKRREKPMTTAPDYDQLTEGEMAELSCPECGHPEHRVYDSRSHEHLGVGTVKRRRACKKCQHRFTTLEFREDQIPDLVEACLRDWDDGE